MSLIFCRSQTVGKGEVCPDHVTPRSPPEDGSANVDCDGSARTEQFEDSVLCDEVFKPPTGAERQTVNCVKLSRGDPNHCRSSDFHSELRTNQSLNLLNF